jgi:hypothetical protein
LTFIIWSSGVWISNFVNNSINEQIVTEQCIKETAEIVSKPGLYDGLIAKNDLIIFARKDGEYKFKNLDVVGNICIIEESSNLITIEVSDVQSIFLESSITPTKFILKDTEVSRLQINSGLYTVINEGSNVEILELIQDVEDVTIASGAFDSINLINGSLISGEGGIESNIIHLAGEIGNVLELNCESSVSSIFAFDNGQINSCSSIDMIFTTANSLEVDSGVNVIFSLESSYTVNSTLYETTTIFDKDVFISRYRTYIENEHLLNAFQGEESLVNNIVEALNKEVNDK